MILQRIIAGKNAAFQSVEALTVKRRMELTSRQRVSPSTQAGLDESLRVYRLWLAEMDVHRELERGRFSLDLARAVIPAAGVLEKAYKRAVLIASLQDAIDTVYEAFDGDAVEVPDDLRELVKEKINGTATAWDDAIYSLAGDDHAGAGGEAT